MILSKLEEDKEIQNIITKIKEKFKISNCGPAEFILGILPSMVLTYFLKF